MGAQWGAQWGAQRGGAGALRGHCTLVAVLWPRGPRRADTRAQGSSGARADGRKAQVVGAFSIRTQTCEKPCAHPPRRDSSRGVKIPLEEGSQRVCLPPSTRPCRSDS